MGLTPWQFPGALLAPESRANILMLAPAGAAAFLFPPGVRRIAALGAALSLPLAIELTQRVWSHLGRACQVFDVVNNMLGVLVGFWLVAGVVAMWESWQRIGPAGDGP
jgi:glycopeptide antibiotics resistance protein